MISLTKHQMKYFQILTVDGQHFISGRTDTTVNLCLISHNPHLLLYSHVPKPSFLLQPVLIHSHLGTVCLRLGKPKGAHWLPSWSLPLRMGKGQSSCFSTNNTISASTSPLTIQGIPALWTVRFQI